MIKPLDKVGVPVTDADTGEGKYFPADVLAVFPPFAEIMMLGQRLSVALDTLTPWDDVPPEQRREPQGTVVPRPMLGDTLPKAVEGWVRLYVKTRLDADRYKAALEQIRDLQSWIETEAPPAEWISTLQDMANGMKVIAKESLEGKEKP